MGECATMLFLTLTMPSGSDLFRSAGTREMHPRSAGHTAAVGTASTFVSFLMGRWGFTSSGKRMQDSTRPWCATALSTVSTKENFSCVCMVGVNSDLKVLVFLCWAAWRRYLFMLRCIGCVFMVGSFCLCFWVHNSLDDNTCVLYFWLKVCYICN